VSINFSDRFSCLWYDSWTIQALLLSAERLFLWAIGDLTARVLDAHSVQGSQWILVRGVR
jgi:hypothetical protein